jgi:hypothetical protein
MFRPLAPSHRPPPRRGTSFILIVVIMTSIMAAVGVAYALFAMQVGRSSDLHKTGQGGGAPAPTQAPNPYNTINQFFGALIFDVGDDGPTNPTDPSDLNNGLRGHSLAASIYGRYTIGNQVAYAGVGTFHEDVSAYGGYGLTGDRATLVNHTLMTINNNAFLLDPEWTGTRATGGNGVPNTFSMCLTGRSYVGKHVGYSYPDMAHFYEAQVDPATGEVLTPSFYRPWQFGTLAPGNPNWTNAQGRLMTLRPRPAEHPQFPYVPMNPDGTYTGDVQNLPGGSDSSYAAKPDSLWVDIGAPVVRMGGQLVKPLVAPLIIPLNGRFNASVHGNAFGASGAHQSYPGFGPSEVNVKPGLAVTLPAAGSAADGLIETDRQLIINKRGTLALRNGTAKLAFDPYTGNVSSAAPVPWNFSTAPAYPAYPSGNAALYTGNVLAGSPAFGAGFQSGGTSTNNHPALFNPTEWPVGTLTGSTLAPASGLTGLTYFLGDSKRLTSRHAFTPDWYSFSQSNVVSLAPNTLGTPANASFAYVPAPGQNTADGYRLDLSHACRGLFASRSYELDRPKVVPSFGQSGYAGLALATAYNTNNQTTANGQQYLNPVATNKPSQVAAGAYPTPSAAAFAAGTVTDMAANNKWVNALAALGSVNLNRPLADYRVNASLALSSPGNVTAASAAAADADRQALAKDIFMRLAAALGGAVNITNAAGTYTYTVAAATPTAATPSPQYDALRYLAQVSANIVDYIDADDISTAFTWDPSATAVGGTVYGVEKPRLVLNEVYGEITNDKGDMPTSTAVPPAVPANPFQVRFWAELLNPTGTLTNAANPIGDGSVSLAAYQIQIRRETRKTIDGTVLATADGGTAGSTNPTTMAVGYNQYPYLFGTPSNTTGAFSTTNGQPDATFSLASQTVSVGPNLNPMNLTAPAPYAPGAVAPATGGFVLVGPPTAANGDVFSPDSTPAGVWKNEVVSPALDLAGKSTGMGYTLPLAAVTNNGTFDSAEFKRHVVLLQRLANPYLAAGATNPYITVDLMDYVPAFDGVARGPKDVTSRNPYAAANTGGYDPLTSRFSVGKVQPYAGHSAAAVVPDPAAPTQPTAGNPNTYAAMQASMVVPQKPTAAAAMSPQHTFGQHNGTSATMPPNPSFVAGTAATAAPASPGTPPSLSDTLMTPFDWLVHMDRPLINQIELFQVRDTPSHQVTDLFLTPAASAANSYTAPGVSYDAGVGNWRDTYAGLTRGLEYLTVKPYVAGVPHGGRVPGRIDLNHVPDQRVLQGLMDPQTGNGFDGNFVQTSAWGGSGAGWMYTRTPGTAAQPFGARKLADGVTTVNRSGVAQATVYDMTAGGTDQPFLPLGQPAAANGSTFAYGAGSQTDQASVLRRTTPTGYPTLYTTAATLPPTLTSNGTTSPYPASLPNGPSYYQAEPLRKIFNNASTVSQQYLVIATIGYFQVVGTVPTAAGYPSVPRLGAEAFVSVPGDARQQVAAVVDMSNMALDPSSNVLAGSAGSSSPGGVQPFFTSLEQTTRPTDTTNTQLAIAYSSFDGTNLKVAADGQEVAITANSTLVVGVGADQQTVTVKSMSTSTLPNGLQVGILTLNAAVTKAAWAGSCVSNVRPGYPGPQSGFAFDSPVYEPIIPFIQRIK